MIDVAVGIDIGTSYTKAAARTEDGTVVAIYRVRSPQFRTDTSTFLVGAVEWWACFKDVLRGLLTVHTPRRLHAISICVSAIAPTLTVFDAAQDDRAYAILYSSLVEKNGAILSQSDPKLTEHRLVVLRSAAHKERFLSPCISDLVGYMNWRLTGNLTINSISLAETGMVGEVRNCDKFVVVDNITPRLVTPSEQIGEITSSNAAELGIETGIPVCGGCPDTMNSVVGAGLTQASETMLYLGTFGSLMRLEANVDTLLNLANCPSPPYCWLLSVPALGPEIETLGYRWFGPVAEVDRLHKLDQAAMQAPAGADGTLFLIPRWKRWMMSVGTYKFVANRNGEIGNVQRQARAVLESIAYAVLALGIDVGEVIKASGSGARSLAWLDILSVVLNRDIQARYIAWEAIGVADIAARLVWRDMAPMRPYYTSHRHADMSRAVIDDNSQRVKEIYYELDWL
jgi:sugar (pentulose or hexulose) kinase